MDILFIVPYMPNLIRVRSYNLIRSLTARGHRVTVMTLWSDEQERRDGEQLKRECYQVHAEHLPPWRSLYNALAAVPTSKPLQSVYCWQPALANQVSELVNHGHESAPFDVIHIEHLRGANYGIDIQSKSPFSKNGRRPPIVWDSVDCITHLFRQASTKSKRTVRRWLTRFELGRTAHYEGWLVKQFDRVLVTSRIDKKALESLLNPEYEPPRISVLPNGVDLTYFKPDDGVNREVEALVVSGKMSYHANVSMTLHLVQEIMPRIWARRPEVRLWIVGKDPPRSILALADHPGITVTGTVEDIRPYLLQATVAVAPLVYGVGFQNKVLEAMACATPVVSTSQAVSALDIRPDQDILVADSPAKFAEKVLYLLDHPEQQKRIGQAGRQYAEKHHAWDRIAVQLEDIYRQTALIKKQAVCLWN